MRFMSTLDPIFDLSVTLGESRSDLVAAAWGEWSDCRRKMNDLSDMEQSDMEQNERFVRHGIGRSTSRPPSCRRDYRKIGAVVPWSAGADFASVVAES